MHSRKQPNQSINPDWLTAGLARLHPAGYVQTLGATTVIPKPLDFFVRWFMVICVSGAIGVVANVVLFFLAAFLFAGAEGDAWVRWYFGNGGIYFVSVTVLLASAAFPFAKKFRSRLV